MKKLYQLLGVRAVEGDFGIEIEVEGTDKNVDSVYWENHADGSLRGKNREYVLQRPVPRNVVRKALEELSEHLKDEKLEFSFRTSVHVHVNIQQLTYPQLLNFIYTYLLLEEPMVQYCGKERKGNRFCLRLADAEGLLDTLNSMFRNGDESIHQINADGVRYASMNVGAITKYGSVEFRAMRGTLDTDVLDTWVEALYRIREYAIKQATPSVIFEHFAELGAAAFIENVLGDISDKFAYPRMVKEIQRSFSLSLDLPYAYSSGEAYRKQLEEQKKTRVKINSDFEDLVRAEAAARAAPRRRNVPPPVMAQPFVVFDDLVPNNERNRF